MKVQPRVFLSPESVLGFGAVDYLTLAAAVVLIAIWATRGRLFAGFMQIAQRPLWSMGLIGILPVALRLALLPHCGVPVASGADDFSFLLSADTLRHWRLANPAHTLPQFFEQVFVLGNPTYSSIYPPGQGIVLALGWMLFGHPWAGVLLSVGAFCALCYWMLRGWTTPEWAFIGGLLAAVEFGPLSYWTNCYWGGAVSAAAGCLVFGALPRLVAGNRMRDAALLGIGLGAQLLTRPFEFGLTCICVLLFLVPAAVRERRSVAGWSAVAAVFVVGAGIVMLFQNKAVTGNWATMPYQLYRYEYGVPATFTFQANAIPHHELNTEEEQDYRAQATVHGEGTDTPGSYLQRLLLRARFRRFFFLPPLYLALLAFVITIRSYRLGWIVLCWIIFALGTNFYPYFYPHYVAVITSLFVLASVEGLRRLNNWIPGAATVLLVLCAVQFLFWYGVHAWGDDEVLARIGTYESWDFINSGDPEGRIAVQQELQRAPGNQVVFVRYGPRHAFHEWVHNEADIDHAHIVWAHDLGASEDEKLRTYYPDRKAWLLEPDARPPRLTPYNEEMPRFEDVR